MKKTLSLIVLIASLGILSAAITGTDITNINPTTGVLSLSAVSIELTVANQLTQSDKIIFTTGSDPNSSTDPSLTIPSPGISSSGPQSFTFTKIGIYNLYLQSAGGTNTKQTGITYTVTMPTNSITSISVNSATINVAISLTLTLFTPINLINGDTLTFSQSSSAVGSAAATEKYTYTKNPDATLSNSFTFTSIGTYNLFLTRASSTSQISGISMIVAPVPPLANLITAVTPTTATSGTATSFTFTLSSASDLAVSNTIVFSTSKTPSNSDASITVSTAPTTASFTGSTTLNSAGTYSVFVSNGIATAQTGITISVVAPVPPLANLITAVTPTTATSGTATSFTFTLSSASDLAVSNTIVFSTSKTPSNSDASITVSTAPTTASFTGSTTLNSAGTYSVFVSNGIATAQTGITIVVAAHSTWISMSLALGALLLMI